ncbi:MAG TPA: type I methionyl aminopeptidase [Longimicrobiales bacterium]|nr:type I methionyl aminopeptidase [Longimicrobiales bacterium]
MIHLKSPDEIDRIAYGGAVIGALFQDLEDWIRPGLSTQEVDERCEAFIRSFDGAVPAFQGLYGFPGAVCVSVNDEIVHGIPSPRRVLESGDIVSVDVGVRRDGWCSDSAWTFPVGDVDPGTTELLTVTRTALEQAVEAARVGGHMGDIGSAVVDAVGDRSLRIVRDLVGHGIGRDVHEEPQVPNIGRQGYGPLLRAGMVLAIEPMLSMGSEHIRTLEDGWTVVTSDRSRSAHFEHTVALTTEGPRVLTRAPAEVETDPSPVGG